MWYYAIKVFISAVIIVCVSEISKRNELVGAIFASIPLVSVLGIIWLYQDTKNIKAVSILSTDIFWLVIPSLVFFIALPVCLKFKINFTISMIVSLGIMITAYFLMILVLRQFGVKL